MGREVFAKGILLQWMDPGQPWEDVKVQRKFLHCKRLLRKVLIWCRKTGFGNGWRYCRGLQHWTWRGGELYSQTDLTRDHYHGAGQGAWDAQRRVLGAEWVLWQGVWGSDKRDHRSDWEWLWEACHKRGCQGSILQDEFHKRRVLIFMCWFWHEKILGNFLDKNSAGFAGPNHTSFLWAYLARDLRNQRLWKWVSVCHWCRVSKSGHEPRRQPSIVAVWVLVRGRKEPQIYSGEVQQKKCLEMSQKGIYDDCKEILRMVSDCVEYTKELLGRQGYLVAGSQGCL